MININDESMTLVIDHRVVATARYSLHATANGRGALIVSTDPARLFGRYDAITALSIAERLAAGLGDDDPFVRSWHEEPNP
jgi:hypothetical protein